MGRWIGFQRDCFSASQSDHMSSELIGILSGAAWHLMPRKSFYSKNHHTYQMAE